MKSATIFTSPGGVRSAQSLRKLVAFANEHGTRFALREVDPFSLVSTRDYPGVVRPTGLAELLLEPKEHLRSLWSEALGAALRDELRGGGAESDYATPVDEADHLLLLVHGVYYSNLNRDFFSAVRAPLIRDALSNAGLELNRVITLIDDIHDVVAHLSQPTFIMEPVADVTAGLTLEPTGRAIQAVMNMQLALHWRAIELFYAGELARELDAVPHIVLAVRHRLQTAMDLCVSDKPIVYLSHPIADVRSSDAFREELSDVTLSLERSGVIPISPTSIDEYRFTSVDRPDGTRMHLPSLDRRWPTPSEEQLLWYPPGEDAESVLDPTGRLQGAEPDGTLGGMIAGLVFVIRQQVNSRDRALVEQASSLVVWRPLFDGKLASGVIEEIGHRNRRFDRRVAHHQPCFVCNPNSDLGKWRIRRFFAEARRYSDLPLSRWNEATSAVQEGMLASHDLVAGFGTADVDSDELVISVARRLPAIVLQREQVGALSPQISVRQRQTSRYLWRDVVDAACASNPLDAILRDGDRVYSRPPDVAAFVSWLGSLD